MNEKLSDDERRLLEFFRCLPAAQKFDALADLASQAITECLPDKTVYDLMPEAAGVRPEGTVYLEDINSVCHVLYCGIQETGEPCETLLGTSDFDEQETIPRFVSGAKKAATEQGSFFNYDEDFARQYITAWRNEIALACKKVSELKDKD